MWKDFFYFSRRERQGIVMLIILITGVFLGKFLFTPKAPSSSTIENESNESREKQEVDRDNTIIQPEQVAYAPIAQKKYYAPIKPNQSTANRNYYTPSTNSQVLPKQKQAQYPVTDKFTAGTIIEINTSDTLQLMKIPGIGTVFAKRITSYRNLLGGFYRLEQLQEVYGMYEELYEKMISYLQADTSRITMIPVNTASLEKLKSHPYINFYQAKAIIEIRKKKGKMDNIHELYLLEEFTEKELDRIKPYLAF